MPMELWRATNKLRILSVTIMSAAILFAEFDDGSNDGRSAKRARTKQQPASFQLVRFFGSYTAVVEIPKITVRR